MAAFPLCPPMAFPPWVQSEIERASSLPSLPIRALIPSWGLHSCDLITSQIPSHRGLGLQHMKLAGTQTFSHDWLLRVRADVENCVVSLSRVLGKSTVFSLELLEYPLLCHLKFFPLNTPTCVVFLVYHVRNCRSHFHQRSLIFLFF